MPDENKQEKKYRTFNIVQQIQFLDEETIKAALEHKSIKRWFYILHDKDIYTEEHINNLQEKFPDNENYKKLKPGQHIVCHLPTNLRTIYVSELQRWRTEIQDGCRGKRREWCWGDCS